jgi:hypothetical protein
MTIFEAISIFIAVVGLFFAIYEGRLNRQYHRISLMPKLIIRQHLGGSQGKYGISITNEGSGVALINSCVVTLSGESMTLKEATMKLEFQRNDQIGINDIAPDGAIAAGKREWLLYAELDNNDFKQKLTDVIKKGRIEIAIVYESVFHEKDKAKFKPKVAQPQPDS